RYYNWGSPGRRRRNSALRSTTLFHRLTATAPAILEALRDLGLPRADAASCISIDTTTAESRLRARVARRRGRGARSAAPPRPEAGRFTRAAAGPRATAPARQRGYRARAGKTPPRRGSRPAR